MTIFIFINTVMIKILKQNRIIKSSHKKAKEDFSFSAVNKFGKSIFSKHFIYSITSLNFTQELNLFFVA